MTQDTERLAVLRERLTRVLAAFEVLEEELRTIGFRGLGGTLALDKQRVKAALWDVVVNKVEPWEV